jgi:UDP-apiose/xylose synthase
MDYLPGIDGEGTPRVLACFMNALLRGEPLPLVGGGAQRRAFMDVSDMSEAVCRVLERPQQSNGQIFNLGNPDNEVSIAELARMLALAFAELRPDLPAARFWSVSAEQFYGPGYDDTQERVPDVRKARQLLGWKPERELAAALPAIVRDYRDRYGARIEAALADAAFPAARSA